MTNVDLISQLASRYGVATGYTSAGGEYMTTPMSSLLFTLNALGVPVSSQPSDEELTGLLYAEYLERSSTPLPACVVAQEGVAKEFAVHVHHGDAARLRIALEGGGEAFPVQGTNDAPPADVAGTLWGEATFALPTDLPLGYHTLHLDSPGTGTQSCPLIITPQRLSTTASLLEHPRSGVMAQLYSVRSRQSWGMGDFHDLGELAATTAQAGADFLLINPLHAAQAVPPVEDSPYLPTSRRYINPIYLCIEDIPELAQLSATDRATVTSLAASMRRRNRSADHIIRAEIYAAKLQALHLLFAVDFSPERAQAFGQYCAREGQALHDFARWCAEAAGAQSADALDHLTSFYQWLQFLCDEQLAAAQSRAKEAGMSIGLMTDLAVGIHPGGAESVSLADYLAPAASVGAPPDEYNQLGQDWSQPPWHPRRLAEAGYQPWRELIATVLRNAGGVRVDHILGLFRLFWIPRGRTPAAGAYVSYDWEALLGVLTLEAERAGAVLVGEDLGTLEPWVLDALASRGVLGTAVLWFEHAADHSQPLAQRDYRALALGSAGTHDLPPTLAYLAGEHITLRAALGLLARPAQEELAAERQWMDRVLALAAAGATEPEEQLVEIHRFIAGTPCALTCTNLVDLVGDRRAQNMPGTTHELYPNWCVPLTDAAGQPVLLEDLPGLRLWQKVAQASRRLAPPGRR
ncbi:4-alpha-glucanotransferase [Corynebacterium lizhenjunii]|uniref:4-alpha-glucanotransferase n=1 Tax=Corynebacterium lizhenjunii TaxID=2709394 RepID=UPI0019826A11|nr:4-alpha-glucanotransferase [Corynebacterium lizhenjunii]